MRKLVLLVTLSIALYSCSNPYPEYREISEELYVQLLELGESDGTSVCNAFQTTISYKLYLNREKENGFDYWNDYTFQNLSPEALGNGVLGETICEMKKGDKNNYLFPYALLKDSYLNDYQIDSITIADTAMMIMEIEIYDLVTEKEFKNRLEKEYKEGVIKENAYLEDYIQTEQLNDTCYFDQDVYWYYLEKTDGKSAQHGMDLAIDYQGYFLDGTEFDNSTLGNATLYFQLGKPEQVIRGFEIVISQMKEGERVRAFIPSHQAFGDKGSSTGIIKEHTPLYFDIHLKEIF